MTDWENLSNTSLTLAVASIEFLFHSTLGRDGFLYQSFQCFTLGSRKEFINGHETRFSMMIDDVDLYRDASNNWRISSGFRHMKRWWSLMFDVIVFWLFDLAFPRLDVLFRFEPRHFTAWRQFHREKYRALRSFLRWDFRLGEGFNEFLFWKFSTTTVVQDRNFRFSSYWFWSGRTFSLSIFRFTRTPWSSNILRSFVFSFGRSAFLARSFFLKRSTEENSGETCRYRSIQWQKQILLDPFFSFSVTIILKIEFLRSSMNNKETRKLTRWIFFDQLSIRRSTLTFLLLKPQKKTKMWLSLLLLTFSFADFGVKDRDEIGLSIVEVSPVFNVESIDFNGVESNEINDDVDGDFRDLNEIKRFSTKLRIEKSLERDVCWPVFVLFQIFLFRIVRTKTIQSFSFEIFHH